MQCQYIPNQNNRLLMRSCHVFYMFFLDVYEEDFSISNLLTFPEPTLSLRQCYIKRHQKKTINSDQLLTHLI